MQVMDPEQSMRELDSQTRQDTDNLLDKKRDCNCKEYENGKGNSMRNITAKLTFAVVCLILLTMISSVGVGLLLGWRIFDNFKDRDSVNDWGESIIIDGRGSVPVDDWIRENIIPENIKNNLISLTTKPHIAGKERNSELARSLYEQWTLYGFDNVTLKNYTVLLDYADRANYNVLELQDDQGSVLYKANTTQEKPLVEVENDPDVPPPFNAYSGVGQAKGPLIYVNYGNIDDFTYLTVNLSLDLEGAICIARYGNIFRGNKAKLAQSHGCKGLIIYSDPIDYAPKDGPAIFPNGPMLPPTGLQRGTLLLTNGDPLTPGLPSIDKIKRRPYQAAVDDGSVPSIPVQPISYGDAMTFLRQLTGLAAPKEWQGGLDITYNILQSEENTNVTILKVNNIKEQAIINDVVGVIYGSVEPDHLVILGNHRDAWTFGAVDPNSGTAVLMEIARILGDMKNRGWRPGRTIILCSWDAEEYGLIGSTEWVENYQMLLGANTVAYLNVDVAVAGMSSVRVGASPLFFNLIYNITKQIRCPVGCKDFETVYDQWRKWYPNSDKPQIDNLGSGSDFASFVQLIGVSSANFAYVSKADYVYYAVYHSIHDNFYWSANFGDPDFVYHKAIGELWSMVAMALVTTPILPYDPLDYSERLMEMFEQLQNIYGEILNEHNISTELLSESLDSFSIAAVNLKNDLILNSNTNNDKVIRILNRKLMNLERSFIQPQGLPGRPYYRHVIAAPSSVNSYAGGTFPGVTDAIFNAKTSQNWDEVHRQIDIVAVHIMYATQIMEQPGLEWL